MKLTGGETADLEAKFRPGICLHQDLNANIWVGVLGHYRIHATITALIEIIHVKWVFFRIRIFLIFLVKQYGSPESSEKMKVGNNCNPYTGDPIQWNADRKLVSKFTKNHAKIHCHNFFLHWDSRKGPHDEDLTQSVYIFYHFIPFLSTHVFMARGVTQVERGIGDVPQNRVPFSPHW